MSGKPRCWLTGASGQLGQCLAPLLAPVTELLAPTRAELDLADPQAVAAFLAAEQPDWIVNAAAYTQVDAAETQTSANQRLNTHLPLQLGQYLVERASQGQACTLLHVSTDYVFSGAGELPWQEHDAYAPVNQYGAAKACADEGLLQLLASLPASAAESSRLLIMRTSWLYHRQGQNFLNAVLAKAKQQSQLTVIDDQFGVPTPADWFATQAMLALTRPSIASGCYHVVPSGCTNWLGVAFAGLSLAVQQGQLSQLPELLPITSAQWPAAAKRPLNSRLDTQKWQLASGQKLPDWHELLRQSWPFATNPCTEPH